MTDKITRILTPTGLLVIDRTHDCPYPGHPDGNYTSAKRECPGCSHPGTHPVYQIVMLDMVSGKALSPPVARWYWRCFGCGRMDEGGAWQPRTEAEYHFSRWQAAQEEDNVGSGLGVAAAGEGDQK